MLRSYFDRSGQLDPFMTLSGIAASEELWTEIDATWPHVLGAGTPQAAYMHMKEAIALRQEFARDKGWDDQKVFDLINALLSYVTTIPQGKYCQFTCLIDMAAYKKLQAETYQMDSPVEICNESCAERVMFWTLMEYKGLDLQASYFFDQGEPFEPIFKAKWEAEIRKDKQSGGFSTWSHIKEVGSADMKVTPGLQIADMLAWGNNREANLSIGYQYVALTMQKLAPTKWIKWDEGNLRKRYRPLIHRS